LRVDLPLAQQQAQHSVLPTTTTTCLVAVRCYVSQSGTTQSARKKHQATCNARVVGIAGSTPPRSSRRSSTARHSIKRKRRPRQFQRAWEDGSLEGRRPRLLISLRAGMRRSRSTRTKQRSKAATTGTWYLVRGTKVVTCSRLAYHTCTVRRSVQGSECRMHHI